jgi:hypothetical protein
MPNSVKNPLEDIATDPPIDQANKHPVAATVSHSLLAVVLVSDAYFTLLQDIFGKRWNRIPETHDWDVFYQSWWGPNGKDAIDAALDGTRFLYVEQDVRASFQALSDTEGFLFVRKEYETMFNRLLNARATCTLMRGCVLLGQPGIGNANLDLLPRYAC